MTTDDADDDRARRARRPRSREPKKQSRGRADRCRRARTRNDLVTLFGPDSKEAAIVSDGKTAHVPRPTPRFAIAAGGYISSRGITFDHDPGCDEQHRLPGELDQGLAAQAAVYPVPLQKRRRRALGPRLLVRHRRTRSASMFTAMDDTGYGDYTIEPLAVGGRRPLPLSDRHRRDRRLRRPTATSPTRSSTCRSRSRSPTRRTRTCAAARTSTSRSATARASASARSTCTCSRPAHHVRGLVRRGHAGA